MPRFPDQYTEKTTPVDADKALIADSAAGNQIKSLSLANLWSYIQSKAVAATSWIATSMVQDGAITSPKIGTAEVKSSNIDFATLNFGNYSTSEVNTGFKWVDGKDIYKKTINFGALPNSTTKAVVHGITGLDFMVDLSATANDGANQQRTLPHINPNALNVGLGVYLSGADVVVTTGANQTAYTICYVTLWYTKT